MPTPDLTRALWRKSSRSNGGGACVEVADNLLGVIAMRDSKDPSGPAFVFKPEAFASFVAGVKGGKFDL